MSDGDGALHFGHRLHHKLKQIEGDGGVEPVDDVGVIHDSLGIWVGWEGAAMVTYDGG